MAAGNRPVREASGWEGPGKGGEARLAGEDEREGRVRKGRGHEGWNQTDRRRGGAGWGLGGSRQGCLGGGRSPSRPRPGDWRAGASLPGFVYMSSQSSLKRLGGGAFCAEWQVCCPMEQADEGCQANESRGGGASDPQMLGCAGVGRVGRPC